MTKQIKGNDVISKARYPIVDGFAGLAASRKNVTDSQNLSVKHQKLRKPVLLHGKIMNHAPY